VISSNRSSVRSFRMVSGFTQVSLVTLKVKRLVLTISAHHAMVTILDLHHVTEGG
jgi:hypothetical protein